MRRYDQKQSMYILYSSKKGMATSGQLDTVKRMQTVYMDSFMVTNDSLTVLLANRMNPIMTKTTKYAIIIAKTGTEWIITWMNYIQTSRIERTKNRSRNTLKMSVTTVADRLSIMKTQSRSIVLVNTMPNMTVERNIEPLSRFLMKRRIMMKVERHAQQSRSKRVISPGSM